MGVERFFSSINKQFDITQNTTYPYTKLKCKYFFIDFNSIVHTISQHMINIVNKYIDNNTNLIPFNYKNIDIFERDMLFQIVDYIVDMLKNNIESDIIETLYIAIDGVPTMAKMYEQKKRRYMGVILSSIVDTKVKKPFSWSKNNISPGTNFMKKLQNVLNSKTFNQTISKICPNIKNIIISDTTSPDEGEIKILEYIKKNNISLKDDIVVYSPDSDMIILLLLLQHNVTILRYDQQKSVLADDFSGKIYNIINVGKFKNVLLNYIDSRILGYNFNPRNVLDDIIFIMTIFGDDFLPKLESIRVNNDIFLILDYYIVNLVKSGHLLEHNKLERNKLYYIRPQSFYNFLLLLSDNELLFLKRNMKQHIYNNYNNMENSIVSYNLYKFRDYLNEYIWKMIYIYRKKKESFVTINPINVAENINIKHFLKFIDSNEPKLNNSDVSKYANIQFNYMDTIIIKELKKIFMEYYLEIIRIIDINKLYNYIVNNDMIRERKALFKNYNMLYYIVDTKENMFIDFILYYYTTNQLPIIIELNKLEPILQKISYNSKDMPHKKKLLNMDKYEKNQYMMDFKLDEYYDILHPRDMFYYNYFTDTFPKRDEIENYYKVHFNGIDKKTIVHNYIVGLNWVLNYYFNFIFDKTWYYPYSKSPLIYDIIDYYDKNILLQIKTDKYTDKTFFTPLEQLIFITPIKLDENLMDQLTLLNKVLSFDDLQILYQFITNNKQYFFELNKIINNIKNKTINTIDCSNSIFLSKCHLNFLEKYFDIDMYLKDFRSVFPLEKQRKYYPLH